MAKLMKPSIKYKDLFINFFEDYINYNEKFRDIIEVEDYIKKLEYNAREEILKPSDTFQFEYWLVYGSYMVGLVRIRNKLNESLKLIGGNIGYKIRPSFRKKGFGKLILKLALEKAKDLKLDKVLLTCNEENIGSIKIIERNGGVFKDSSYVEEAKSMVRRYWINIS